MTELMTVVQYGGPALAMGAASLGAAILASARDRVADSVVTRGHALLEQTLRHRREGEESGEGDNALTGDEVVEHEEHEEYEEYEDVLAQLSDDERELVDAAAGQSAGVVLAVGDGSVALDKLTVHGGNITIGGTGTGTGTPGQDSP